MNEKSLYTVLIRVDQAKTFDSVLEMGKPNKEKSLVY